MTITQDTKILNFEGSNFAQKICIRDSKSLYNLILDKPGKFDIDFVLDGNSQIDINIFVLAKNVEIKGKINVHVQSSQTKANINIISFLAEGGRSDVDGKIDVPKDIIGFDGNLQQKTIFLGSKGHTKSTPILNLSSNEISAHHGVSIQKLDESKIFYAQSKGLDEKASKEMLLSGYFENFFSEFGEHQDLKEKYLKLLLD